MHISTGDLATVAHRQRLHVTIDGPAGAGKSTVGRSLSLALACAYVDTGLMYRAVTLRALDRRVELDDSTELEELARSIVFDIRGEGDALLIDGVPPSAELRSTAVDSAVSLVSAHPGVREQLVGVQRAMAENRCVVMVGRDIGTVVLPHAPVKLWVTASAKERGRRRLVETAPGNPEVTASEMVEKIMDRDELDSQRSVSPLRRPVDAIDVESDRLDQVEALECALKAVEAALSTDARG